MSAINTTQREPRGKVLSRNSRGIVARGRLFDRIGFYTELYDNIIRYPQYIISQYKQAEVLSGETFVKPFGDRGNALDFFHSRAYLTLCRRPGCTSL